MSRILNGFRRLTALFCWITCLSIGMPLLAQQWDGATNSSGDIHRDGSVAIGRTNATNKTLEVFSSALAYPVLIEGGQTRAGIQIRSTEGDGYIFTQSDGLRLTRQAHGNDIVITTAGLIGLGTPQPEAKLDVAGDARVDGTVTAREIVVSVDAFADDVFEADYPLLKVEELEAAISELGHLPGIPSAAEVAVDGIALGDMQVQLLRKIEELTLYVIDLKKENAGLGARLASLEVSQ